MEWTADRFRMPKKSPGAGPPVVRALAALLLACSASLTAGARAAEPTRMTLGYLPSNAFLAAFVARDQGFFARRGLDVSFDLLPNGALLRQALSRGSVQIGTMTPPAVLRSDSRGARLRIVAAAAVQDNDHPTAGIVAGQRSGIHSAADFRGRKVGVPGVDGLNHLVFMKWLQNHQLDPRQVRFVHTVLPQMAEALKSGRVDAVVPVEPFLESVLQGNSGYLVAKFPGEVAKSYVQAVYVMPGAWAERHGDQVRAFREALREGTEWIAGHENAARRTQMRYLKISESAALAAPLPQFATDISAADVGFWIGLCSEFGVTRTPLKAADVLVP